MLQVAAELQGIVTCARVLGIRADCVKHLAFFAPMLNPVPIVANRATHWVGQQVDETGFRIKGEDSFGHARKEWRLAVDDAAFGNNRYIPRFGNRVPTYVAKIGGEPLRQRSGWARADR